MEEKRASPGKAAEQWARFSLHVRDWFGPRFGYDPTSHEIVQKFHSVRSFQFTNEEKTAICHRNKMTMPDGKIVHGGPWVLSSECVMEDGLQYPVFTDRRACFHKDGSFVFTPQLCAFSGEPAKFVCEIGDFCSPEYRFTDGITYQNGKLQVVSLWREHSEEQPETPFWSTDNQMKDGWQVALSDQLATGEERIITSNLDEQVKPDCSWDRDYWTSGGQENNLYFLPENVTLSCPTDISDGRDFHLAECWIDDRSDERVIREHTVQYCNGHFSSFKQGVYRQGKP